MRGHRLRLLQRETWWTTSSAASFTKIDFLNEKSSGKRSEHLSDLSGARARNQRWALAAQDKGFEFNLGVCRKESGLVRRRVSRKIRLSPSFLRHEHG
jgi:hypothetical protein